MTTVPNYEALERFEQQYIPFPPFVAAKTAIEDNLQLFRQTGIAQHLLILGDSGTGKSSLCRWIAEQHPPVVLPDGDVHSALIGTVPPTATVTSMADVLLDGLGDVERGRSPLAAKTRRVVLLCRGCRVELLLLDEAQHLHDRGDTRTHYLVGDWLKHLIDEVGVPTVLLGLPRLEQLLMVNEQLRRRFSRRIRLGFIRK